MYPSHTYRNYLRDIRMIMSPAQEAMLCGEPINNLSMGDLEALYELVTGANPRCRAPTDYEPRH
jgi:hypothetical protein